MENKPRPRNRDWQGMRLKLIHGHNGGYPLQAALRGVAGKHSADVTMLKFVDKLRKYTL